MKKQAPRSFLASLLFVFLAGCTQTPQPTPTALPTVRAPQPSPSATSLVETSTPAPQIREDIEYYIVEEGDTVSSIAEQFGLQPETVLWANYNMLFDSPDFLMTGMELLILPLNGVYHQVGGTDTVQNIAAFFGADPQDILDWPANGIQNSVIFAGQWLTVPGGERQLRRRMMPNLPSYAMAVSIEEFGSGACPENLDEGAVGDGQFVWPVADPKITAEGFSAIHPGVDLAVNIGANVFASDDGVVVFSGWSNFGYGLTVMVDHGNGDFSVYGGLGEVVAVCGASVNKGQVVGVGGDIGHPAGSFVHFEIRRGEEFVDPFTVILD